MFIFQGMGAREHKYKFRDITQRSEDTPPPWHNVQTGEGKGKPPWAPQSSLKPVPSADGEEQDVEAGGSGRVPVHRRLREFPRGDSDDSVPSGPAVREAEPEGSWWISRLRRLLCSRKRRDMQDGLAPAVLPGVRRITPSCYTAMEIHGFFGLVDDGLCGSGRMLIVHQPSWVRGNFLDIKDGDDIHVWHVSGTSGGVLRVLSTGRHRYYSPGQKVTTCTICVPEEQWESLMQ